MIPVSVVVCPSLTSPAAALPVTRGIVKLSPDAGSAPREPASIAALEVGQHIKAGEVIGFLGSSKINGDYPPHLHFQIIKDLQGNFGDYPGVCNSRSLDFYKNNCPDPSLILKLEG